MPQPRRCAGRLSGARPLFGGYLPEGSITVRRCPTSWWPTWRVYQRGWTDPAYRELEGRGKWAIALLIERVRVRAGVLGNRGIQIGIREAVAYQIFTKRTCWLRVPGGIAQCGAPSDHHGHDTLAVLAGGRVRHSVPGAPSGQVKLAVAGGMSATTMPIVPQHGAVHGHGPSGGRRSGHGGKER